MKSEAQLLIDSYIARTAEFKAEEAKLAQKKAELKEALTLRLESLAKQDKVFTLELDEWRDDSVSAFQVAQAKKVIVTDVSFSERLGVAIPVLEKLLYTKTGKLKFKKGKPDTRKIRWNPFCSWRVVDYLHQPVFGYTAPQVIHPEKYTEERLSEIRARLAEVQVL